MALPTSYCSFGDVASILGQPGIDAHSDDDHSGDLSTAESLRLSEAIERAAVLDINYCLAERYDLEAMASNVWLKWANAVLAAYEICLRTNAAVAKSLTTRVEQVREMLQNAKLHRGNIPESVEASDWLPAVSNFEVERWRNELPIRVNVNEATRAAPPSHIKRNSSVNYNWWI